MTLTLKFLNWKKEKTKEESESDEAYNKRIYNTFIENYIKGKGGTPEGKKGWVHTF